MPLIVLNETGGNTCSTHEGSGIRKTRFSKVSQRFVQDGSSTSLPGLSQSRKPPAEHEDQSSGAAVSAPPRIACAGNLVSSLQELLARSAQLPLVLSRVLPRPARHHQTRYGASSRHRLLQPECGSAAMPSCDKRLARLMLSAWDACRWFVAAAVRFLNHKPFHLTATIPSRSSMYAH